MDGGAFRSFCACAAGVYEYLIVSGYSIIVLILVGLPLVSGTIITGHNCGMSSVFLISALHQRVSVIMTLRFCRSLNTHYSIFQGTIIRRLTVEHIFLAFGDPVSKYTGELPGWPNSNGMSYIRDVTELPSI